MWLFLFSTAHCSTVATKPDTADETKTETLKVETPAAAFTVEKTTNELEASLQRIISRASFQPPPAKPDRSSFESAGVQGSNRSSDFSFQSKGLQDMVHVMGFKEALSRSKSPISHLEDLENPRENSGNRSPRSPRSGSTLMPFSVNGD